MSNHYHIVLKLDSAQTKRLTDEELADRWLTLCPIRSTDPIAIKMRRTELVQNKTRLSVIRDRLGSLSWYMRFLNEPLARIANKEDDCSGRFWEGRFKSQRLLDENAILACMVYVDLNPVRAGIANDPTTSEHTSLSRRLSQKHRKPGEHLRTLNQGRNTLPVNQTLETYIKLTNRVLAAQQSHRRQQRNAFSSWVDRYLPKPGCWQRAIGSLNAMRDYAQDIGQNWIKTAPAPD